MEIKYINIGDLRPAEYNPRKTTDHQKQEISDSLKRFGLVEPLVVNFHKGREGIIVGGHQRYYELLKQGVTDIPVSVVNLDEESEKELNIRLNKNVGGWDAIKLEEYYTTDQLKEWGFLDEDFVDLKVFEEERQTVEDEAPEVSQEPAISKLGEVYQLGRHRLMCGDSTKIEDVEKLMDGQKADMVFTDPPYGVSYASKNEYLNSISRGNRIQTPIENDHMSIEDTSNFIYEAFVNLKMSLAPKSSYYITAPQGGDLLMMMMMMMQKAGLILRHMLIWVKNNHVLGRTDYNYKHEPILFGWVETHSFYGAGKYKFSTWEIDKPHKSDMHPTMKPVELIANALQNSTEVNDRVLDLFGGSGSTLIACEQLNRTCYMMELDPKYCDVIRKRYAKFTGSPDLLI